MRCIGMAIVAFIACWQIVAHAQETEQTSLQQAWGPQHPLFYDEEHPLSYDPESPLSKDQLEWLLKNHHRYYNRCGFNAYRESFYTYHDGSSGERSRRQLDLSGIDFTQHNLRESDFDNYSSSIFANNYSDVDLSGTTLRGGFFWRDDLSRANLENADLTGADLLHADLRLTNLSGATLADVKTGETLFWGANLFGIRGLSEGIALELLGQVRASWVREEVFAENAEAMELGERERKRVAFWQGSDLSNEQRLERFQKLIESWKLPEDIKLNLAQTVLQWFPVKQDPGEQEEEEDEGE